MQRFLDILRRAGGLLSEFDETLWRTAVVRVTVHTATEFIFTFRDGGEVRSDIGKK